MKILLLLLMISFTACTIKRVPPANEAESTSNFSVDYETLWSSPQDIQEDLRNADAGNINVLIINPWCSQCTHIASLLVHNGWDAGVHVLNSEEMWVQKLFHTLKVRKLPTLVVTDGQGQRILKKIDNERLILSYLRAYSD